MKTWHIESVHNCKLLSYINFLFQCHILHPLVQAVGNTPFEWSSCTGSSGWHLHCSNNLLQCSLCNDRAALLCFDILATKLEVDNAQVHIPANRFRYSLINFSSVSCTFGSSSRRVSRYFVASACTWRPCFLVKIRKINLEIFLGAIAERGKKNALSGTKITRRAPESHRTACWSSVDSHKKTMKVKSKCHSTGLYNIKELTRLKLQR